MRTGASLTSRLAACAGLLLLTAAPLAASDGVIEINQARALAGGVSGNNDVAGFPVTLEPGKSYVLTSDLDVTVPFPGAPPPQDRTAIDVPGTDSDHPVTIDLNGFTIRGPVTCSAPGVCGPLGAGAGVYAYAANLRNGTISGMGSYGASIQLGNIENVTFTSNGFRGIYTTGARVDRCSVIFNTQTGIYAGTASIVSNTQALSNGGDGIWGAGLVTGSLAANNVGFGFRDIGSLHESVAYGNLPPATDPRTQISCHVSQCAMSGNRFGDCSGVGCFEGTEPMQLPPASNMCGTVVCP